MQYENEGNVQGVGTHITTRWGFEEPVDPHQSSALPKLFLLSKGTSNRASTLHDSTIYMSGHSF